MSDKAPAWIDPSKKASSHLDDLLQKGQVAHEDIVIVDESLERVVENILPAEEVLSEESTEVLPQEETISVSEAREETSVLIPATQRNKTRLLVLTKDETVMQPGSVAHRRFVDQQDLFFEIHIVVLTLKGDGDERSIQRFAENVWMYTTCSSSTWSLAYDAYAVAEAQLMFSGGFRADIIVAEDTFESGLAGWFLSQKHTRAFQLHIYDDFFDQAFINEQTHPLLYEWATEYLLQHVSSVRTKTESQRQAVIAERSELEPVTEIFPAYYNLEAWKDFVPTINLNERYPQFKFIILHISSMQASSHSQEVLSGVAKLLRQYPTIGLVIVGNGPLRTLLEKQAISLGIQRQVEFEPAPTEVISYMKSADVLVHLSENSAEDEYILEAAVAKLPMVLSTKGLASTLFTSVNESACLCDPTDIGCITESINMYLNKNHDRARYAINAYDAVFERVVQDYSAYKEAYSQSIERCLITES